MGQTTGLLDVGGLAVLILLLTFVHRFHSEVKENEDIPFYSNINHIMLTGTLHYMNGTEHGERTNWMTRTRPLNSSWRWIPSEMKLSIMMTGLICSDSSMKMRM